MEDRKIGQLLDDIGFGRIALPEIQREYVWSPQKAMGLIDSIYQEYPIGSVLLWRPNKLFNHRWLDDQNAGNQKHPDWYILDGQQRLTSLHKIVKGDIKICYHIDNKEFKIESKGIIKDPKWVRIDEIIRSDTATILKILSKTLNQPKDIIYDEYHEGIRKISEITDQVIAVSEIREDDYERIREIYVRLNERGTKLRKAEINFAILIVQFPKIFYKRFTALMDEFDQWELDSNFFLKCFVCITTKQSKFEMLRKHITTATDKEIKTDLNKIRDGVEETIQFLKSNFGINQYNNHKLIPSTTALIALVTYHVENNGRVGSDRDLELLKLWFFMASHYSRYSGSSETVLNKDLRFLKQTDPLKEWIMDIKSERKDLKMDKLQGRIDNTNLFALNWALFLNNARDWWSGSTVVNMSNIELHHIFPKKILREANCPDKKINDICNIAIVSKKANRSISSKEPKEYFNDIDNRDSVFSQFVPEDERLWSVERYEEFLKAREKLIINKLNQVITECYSRL